MKKYILLYISLCSPLLILTIPKDFSVPDRVVVDPPIKETMDQRQAREKNELTQQQESDRDRLTEKQAQEKNELFTKYNTISGKIDDNYTINFQKDLENLKQKHAQEDNDLDQKLDNQTKKQADKHKQEVKAANSLTARLGKLFSREEKSESSSPKTQEKTQHTSFDRNAESAFKDFGMRDMKTNKEKFATDPDYLKNTLNYLTNDERQNVLNAWLKECHEEYQTAPNKEEYLKKFNENLDDLYRNLEKVLPDNVHIGMIDDKKPFDPTILTSSDPDKLSFKLSKRISETDRSKTYGGRKSSPDKFDSVNDLFDKLDQYRHITQREDMLEKWMKSAKTSYDRYSESPKDSKKNQQEKLQLQTLTARSFGTDLREILKRSKTTLPKGEKLVLYDQRGKPVNTADLFTKLDMYQATDGASQPEIYRTELIKSFNPSNYSFRIVKA